VHVDRSTGPDFEDEVLALIREWRFQAAMRNGVPIQVHGYLDFSHGIDPQAPVPQAPAPQPGIRKK
jgi:hypothetical protein